MKWITAATLLALWLLGTGLACVHYEVRSVHCGARIRRLLSEESWAVERLRNRQVEYGTLISPDLLEQAMEEESDLEVPGMKPTAPEAEPEEPRAPRVIVHDPT